MIKSSKKKVSAKRLRTLCDAEVRRIIFQRDGNKCVRCSAGKGLTPSHVLPKGRCVSLRWETENVLTLCVACHLYWWHLNPLESSDWFRKNWPDRYERLKAASLLVVKINISWLKSKLAELRAEP